MHVAGTEFESSSKRYKGAEHGEGKKGNEESNEAGSREASGAPVIWSIIFNREFGRPGLSRISLESEKTGEKP